MGIRLNKHKPNIYFKVRPITCRLGASWGPASSTWGRARCSCLSSLLQPKKGGGISFNSTVTLTQCSEKLVQLILHEYSNLTEGRGGGCRRLAGALLAGREGLPLGRSSLT